MSEQRHPQISRLSDGGRSGGLATERFLLQPNCAEQADRLQQLGLPARQG